MWQILLYVAVMTALAKPMGAFMARVFAGERTWARPVLRPLESAIYRFCGIDENARAALDAVRGRTAAFQRGEPAVDLRLDCALQQWLPLNPQELGNVWRTLRSTRRSASTRIRTGSRTRPRRP